MMLGVRDSSFSILADSAASTLRYAYSASLDASLVA